MSAMRPGQYAMATVCLLACQAKQPTDGDSTSPAAPARGQDQSTISITSSAFGHGQEIPTQYTCEGEDRSPPLSWSSLPEGAKSLALIVDDPDAPDPAAPKRVWVHWVLYDIPPTATALEEAVTTDGLPAGTKQGKNDWDRVGYGGPCPPIGRHRYFHKLYALDVELGDLGEPTRQALERAMKGHVLAAGELVGTYEKNKE
jgi:Raf kinase inhibitor-like YbhB/YbcL family protein